MRKKLTQKEIAEHPNESVRGIASDLDKASSLSAVSDTEGGKLLLASLVSDIVGIVDGLSMKYSTLTMQEFVSLCAEMKSKTDLARAISRSKKNKAYLVELLDDALTE